MVSSCFPLDDIRKYIGPVHADFKHKDLALVANLQPGNAMLAGGSQEDTGDSCANGNPGLGD